MTIDTSEIWQYLKPEPQTETAVLSAVASRFDGELVLLAASLLIGPAEIGSSGWPHWSAKHGDTRQQEALFELPAEFSAEQEAFVIVRKALTLEDAQTWVDEALNHHVADLGYGYVASAHLERADAPLRTVWNSLTPAETFVSGMKRPAAGFHFKPEGEPWSTMPPDGWEICGHTTYMTIPFALGLSFVTEPERSPHGLFVGRFERRAWLEGQLLHPETSEYEIRIGIEPERVDPADLEVELAEYRRDELLLCQRIALEDDDLLEATRNVYEGRGVHDQMGVRLLIPTIGKGVQRSLRLFHRDGNLLDAWDRYSIAEQVTGTFHFGGGVPLVVKSGSAVTRTSAEYLAAIEHAQSEYRAMRVAGVVSRIHEDRSKATDYLLSLFRSIDSEILILDPFFDEWSLIQELRVGARLLTGRLSTEKIAAVPSGVAPAVRHRKSKGPTPFHDRFALWRGGGITFGTSLQAGGKDRLFRMDRMSVDESTVLRAKFDDWWDAPEFEPLLAQHRTGLDS